MKKKYPDYASNAGYYFPNPGIVNKANCGVCGTEMDVKRNVSGPTSWSESMAHKSRLHDSFYCPHYGESWHKLVVKLMREASDTSSKRVRKMIEKDIADTLRKKRP